jgi:sugar phosphate permease
LQRRIFYGWTIVATLFVVNFAIGTTGGLNLGLFIIPMGNDLGMSRSLFGWLSTARSLSGGASSIILGRLVDRFGSRILIPISSLITGLCLIGVGLTNHVYQTFLLFALMGLVGLSAQGGSLLSSVPVAKWFVRRRGTALSLATLGMGIGPIVFVPVTQLLIDGVGWRTTWIILACISMTIIIPLALIFLRRQPEDMGLLPDGDAARTPETGIETIPSDVEAVWTVRQALRTRTFWMLTASLMLAGFAMGSSIHRIPYWMELGFDPRVVSLAFSTDAAGAAIMILAAGFLLDRFAPRFVAAGALAGFAGAVALMLTATSTFHMFASTVLFGFSVGINMVCQTYLWASYYGRTFLGAIRGITMPITLLPIAAGAPVAGYIYDSTGGYELAWQMAIGLYIVALLVMLGATPPLKRSA